MVKKEMLIEAEKKIKLFSNKGITLITLVITIIILLILVSIVISITIGRNGIFERAKYAIDETKKAQVQEEIQLVVTDIVVNQLSQEETLENLMLKEEIEEHNLLKGITIDENLVGTYKNYNYFIDEQYKVHIGEKIQEELFEVEIKIQETKRKIEVLVTNAKEGIQKIQLFDPNAKIIVEQELDGTQTNISINGIANLSGIYKAKVISKTGKVATKTIEVRQIKINNKAELIEFGEIVESGVTFEGDTITLLSDIYLEGSSSNRNWNSIGSKLRNTYFSGTFEGNNHKIYDLYNSKTNERQQGFFGCIVGGTIKDLGIESGNIVGYCAIGGIAGRADNSEVINCYNKASVRGEVYPSENMGTTSAGGIIGYGSNIMVRQCYNTGSIYACGDVAGGIVSLVDNKGEIVQCYNIGNVTTDATLIGGIAGVLQQNSKGIINNCYNKGNIVAKVTKAGGLVGEVRVGENEVRNSYNTGNIISNNNSNAVLGGVIGENNGVLSNLFFINTAGPAYGCGLNNTQYSLEESRGSTQETLKGLTNKLNEGQDNAVWQIDEKNINGGYPILRWQ